MTIKRHERIAVAGIGCISALGRGVEQTVDALRAGPDCVHPAAPRTFVSELGDRYPVFEIAPSPDIAEATTLDATQRALRLARIAAAEALSRALSGAALDVDPARCGVVVGGTVGGMNGGEIWIEDLLRGGPARIPPRAAVRHVPLWGVPSDLAHRHGFHGPAFALTTACTSGAAALAAGADLIQAGTCDVVLAGGVDVLARLTYHGFGVLGLLSERRCRPFDADRDGLTLGEGAAFVVLARADLVPQPRAYLLGWAGSSDAHHLTAPSPDGDGTRRVVEGALERAGVAPADVDWVHAHGTATPNNDAVEARALAAVFGAACPPVSSTKHLTGHTLGAAGALATVFSVAAMEAGFVPGNSTVERQDPEITVPLVPPEGLEMTLSRVVVNSLGFGGTNCALVLGGSRLRGGGRP